MNSGNHAEFKLSNAAVCIGLFTAVSGQLTEFWDCGEGHNCANLVVGNTQFLPGKESKRFF